MEEIEVKFLDIDSKQIEKTLHKLGAKKIYDRIFKDRVFDFPGWPLDAKASWLRLRNKGDEITLSFKKRLGVVEGQDDQGMEEIEVKVSDFDKTSKILESTGLIQKFNDEKRRIHFELDGADIDIDTWPMIPTYLEIEADSWKKVEDAARRLGLDWTKHRKLSAMQIYKLYGINEKDYSIIAFTGLIKRN